MNWKKGEPITLEIYQNGYSGEINDRKELSDHSYLIGKYTFDDPYSLLTAVQRGAVFKKPNDASKKGVTEWGVYGKKNFPSAEITVKLVFGNDNNRKNPFSFK